MSPPTKRSKLDIVAGDKVDFILIISADVLIDLLRFGRRRQLAALESIGVRFHVLIEAVFSKAPFIYFKYLCSQIEMPAWHFNKLDEQNKLQGVEDETVQFLLLALINASEISKKKFCVFQVFYYYFSIANCLIGNNLIDYQPFFSPNFYFIIYK